MTTSKKNMKLKQKLKVKIVSKLKKMALDRTFKRYKVRSLLKTNKATQKILLMEMAIKI